MEPQDVAQLSSCHRPVAEDREKVEFDRREQYLGRPERRRSLQDRSRIEVVVRWTLHGFLANGMRRRAQTPNVRDEPRRLHHMLDGHIHSRALNVPVVRSRAP
jgi:hypothetical protein